jgi:hypothetical protein
MSCSNETTDNSTMETMEWKKLWTASKHLDSARIRKCLLDPHANANDGDRESSLLLPHTDASFALHKYIFGGQHDANVQVEQHTPTPRLDQDACPDFSKAEKKRLGLRSMLLLPPYSFAPWDAMKSYFHLLQGTRSSTTRNETLSNCGTSIVTRKSMGDVRVFLSSLCKRSTRTHSSGGNDDDWRTIHAQRDEMLCLCNVLVKQLYNRTDHENECPEFEGFVFQLIAPLYKAALRTDDCLVKKRQNSNDRAQQNSLSVSLSARFLDSLLSNSDGRKTSGYIIPSKIPSLLTVANDLKKQFSLENWSSLQSLILHSIQVQRNVSNGRNIDIHAANGITSSIIAHIATDLNLVDDESGCILIQWAEIILVTYHVSSLRDQGLQGLDMHVCNSLPNLSDGILNNFLQAVTGRNESSTISRDTSITITSSGVHVPNWIRTNMLLLVFYSRQGIPTVHNYAAKIMGYDQDANVENNDLVMDSLLTLIRRIIKDNSDQDEMRKNIELYESAALEDLRQILSRNGKNQEKKLYFSFSKLSQLRSMFKECKLLVKSSSNPNAGERISCDERTPLDPRNLWRNFAHHSIENITMIDEVDRLVVAGAILITLFDEDPSSKESMTQDIVDNLRKCNGRNQDGIGGSLVYCWILHVMITRSCENETIVSCGVKSGESRTMFSPIYKLVQRDSMVLSRNITVELMRSLACIPDGRSELTRYCLQDIKDGSPVNHGNPRLQYGIDGIILLLQFRLPTNTLVDESLLLALSFISDEIVRKQSIMTDGGRLDLLARLLSACEEGQLHNVVLERILNAALVRILPYFRCKCNTNGEIQFVPNHLLCTQTEKGATSQEEMLLLLHLILIPIGNNPELQRSTSPENDVLYVFRDVFDETLWLTRDEMARVEKNLTPAHLTAMSIIRSLTKYFLNCARVSDFDYEQEVEGEHLPCDKYFEVVRCQEAEFWAKAQLDLKLGATSAETPEWVNCSLIDLSTGLADIAQLPQPMCSALSAVLFTKIFSMNRNHERTTSGDDKFKRSFYISFAAISMLHAIWTCRTEEESSWMRCDFVSADYEYSNVAAYFSSTSDVFGTRVMDSDYLELLLPATFEVCSRLDAMLLSDDIVRSSIIATIYQSLVKFYCTVCDQKEENTGLASKPIRELKIPILRCLCNVMINAPFAKASSASELDKDKAKIHLTLLLQLSKDLHSELEENTEETKTLCRLYTKSIENLIDTMVHILTSYSTSTENVGDKWIRSDWEETVQSSSTLLWDALQHDAPQKPHLFKALVSIAIRKMPELLRLIRRLGSLFSASLYATGRSTGKESRESSFATATLDLCAKDMALKSPNKDELTSQYSWLPKNDSKLNEWTLLLCLDIFESMWMESNQIISGNTSSTITSSGMISFQRAMVEKYARIILSDLRSTLSSGILLQTKCAGSLSPEVLQKVCSCVEKVIVTLSNALSCILRYLKSTGKTEKANHLNSANPTTLESFICLIAWLETSPPDDTGKISSKHADFVLVSKSWCKSGGHRKEFVKRSSKVLDRIEDLEGTLIKLSKQLKRMNSIKDGGDIDRIVNSLLPQSEHGGFNLILSIDKYMSKIGITTTSSESSKKESTKSPSKSFKTERNEKAKRPSRVKPKGKKRCRNSVVNDWLDQDQEMDGKRDNDVYDDLEDFILPG